jgi:hypothetical protein
MGNCQAIPRSSNMGHDSICINMYAITANNEGAPCSSHFSTGHQGLEPLVLGLVHRGAHSTCSHGHHIWSLEPTVQFCSICDQVGLNGSCGRMGGAHGASADPQGGGVHGASTDIVGARGAWEGFNGSCVALLAFTCILLELFCGCDLACHGV